MIKWYIITLGSKRNNNYIKYTVYNIELKRHARPPESFIREGDPCCNMLTLGFSHRWKILGVPALPMDR